MTISDFVELETMQHIVGVHGSAPRLSSNGHFRTGQLAERAYVTKANNNRFAVDAIITQAHVYGYEVRTYGVYVYIIAGD